MEPCLPANSLTVPIKQRLLNQFTMRNAVFEYWGAQGQWQCVFH